MNRFDPQFSSGYGVRGASVLHGGVFCLAFVVFFSGVWLLAPSASGFWLHFSMEGMYIYIYLFLFPLLFNCCILEPKSLICVLFAALWS